VRSQGWPGKPRGCCRRRSGSAAAARRAEGLLGSRHRIRRGGLGAGAAAVEHEDARAGRVDGDRSEPAGHADDRDRWGACATWRDVDQAPTARAVEVPGQGNSTVDLGHSNNRRACQAPQVVLDRSPRRVPSSTTHSRALFASSSATYRRLPVAGLALRRQRRLRHRGSRLHARSDWRPRCRRGLALGRRSRTAGSREAAASRSWWRRGARCMSET
jgi:hypothetical protein